MIASFRQAWLADFYLNGRSSKRIPVLIEDRLLRKLQLLDDATSYRDLLAPPGNRFERLSGRLQACCSIRVNRQWRLIFEWDERRGKASALWLDNHDYRMR